MSHFYGILRGKAGEATRQGNVASGLTTIAASWRGAIRVQLWCDGEVDRFVVSQIPWQGTGIEREIASGIVGYHKETP